MSDENRLQPGSRPGPLSSAAHYLDGDVHVISFTTGVDIDLAIPYRHHGEKRDYVPDFLVRLQIEGHEVGTLLLEIEANGDALTQVKAAAALRWVAAVNAEGSSGRWAYRLALSPDFVPAALESATRELAGPPRRHWQEALGKFVEEVRAAYGGRLRQVFLYGSRARGDADEDSDIDVLVVLDRCDDQRGERERLSAIALRITMEHDHVLSAFPIAQAEFETESRPVIVNARREGRVVG